MTYEYQWGGHPPQLLEPWGSRGEIVLGMFHPAYPTHAQYVVEDVGERSYRWKNVRVVTSRRIPESSTEKETRRATRLMWWEHVSISMCPIRPEWQPVMEELL